MIKWIKKHLPTKRRLIQLYSALLFNCYSKGYITGEIFKGASKNLCTPGLNCYSCPGAVTSCPLGALQNAFSDANKTAPYYILGILMLYGIMLGRWICGWLCPFGLVQDLLHKIKTPKLKKNAFTKALSLLKYVILAVFVVIIPLIYMFRDFPLPAFCKYICPAGTLGGAIGLLINPENEGMFGMLGPLFTWKFVLMISIIVGTVFIYRMFCRFLCPLGAIYGLFNKISLFGIKLEKSKCISCGKCINVCPMDIKEVGDRECISCGRCVGVCPTKAISYKGAKVILPDSELENAKTNEEKAAVEEKRTKRVKLITRITALVLCVILGVSMIYFNFIHKDPTENIPVKGEVGYKCPGYDLQLVNGQGTLNVSQLEGKIVIINFWGTWCGPCKAELPYFNRIASEYDGEVVVLTVHTTTSKSKAPAYIEENFPDSKMLFVYDEKLDNYRDMYFTLLGGSDSYPRTLVLDERGVITFAADGGLEYEDLVEQINIAKGK